ncbi:hypothetical protein Bca101_067465 [Brassica carinata]
MANLKTYYDKGKGKANCQSSEGNDFIWWISNGDLFQQHSYVVVMAGCWIRYCNGDWDFKIDKDRMGRAIDVEFITSVDKLKERILEEYGLLGAPVTVDFSYWFPVAVSSVTGERVYPLQISTINDYKVFTSFRIVSKLSNVFVTFRDKVDETTSAVVDVVSGKEMKGGGEEVLDDATILMYVEQIEAVYSAKALELAVVDGTAIENEKTVDNKDGEIAEDDEEDEEEYDYNEWHDFVSRNCEWDDGKDEEGGAAGGQSGGRTNKSNVGVRGEVAPRKAVGGKTADQSRSNGGGSSGKKHGRDELKAKSSFEEYIDDGREYIVTSRSCLGGIDDDDFVESNHPEVVLVTPPKESNQHRREVLRDVVDDDDFVDDVPHVEGKTKEKKTWNDPSFMKSVKSVELYGFEDVEPLLHGVPVNDYSVDDIDFSLADCDIYVGRLFSSKQEFKINLSIFAIKHVFRFRFHKHAKNYVTAKCFDKTCKFYVMAKQMGESSTYQVRKASLAHRCRSDVKAQFRKHATSKVIAYLMRSKYERLQAGPRAAELPEALQTEFLFTATYWKYWKAKELAAAAAQGTEENSYKLLPKYFHVVEHANPGSITDIKTEKDEKRKTRFKYAFMALKACIDGWKHLRQVLVVDGTHMFGKYKGCLLTASGQDANYQVFPIAFAVVDNETNESWSWFFEKLLQIVEDGPHLTIVSDRASQIYVAKDLWYPRAHHGCCLVHLQRNVDGKFKKRNQKQLVGRAAEAFKQSHFHKVYEEIKLTDICCWNYLELIDLKQWTRSHFEGERYNLMSSNIEESLNKALVPARDSPIMALFEFIRRMISRWFVSRQRKISRMTGEIPPAVDVRLSENLLASRAYAVLPLSAWEFEVTVKTTGYGSTVNLDKRTCSCLEFQKIGIPCRHAIAATQFRDLQHSEFVGDIYLSATWDKTTKGVTLPVPDPKDVFISPEVSELVLFPPKTKRPPGRPPTKHKRVAGEIPVRHLFFQIRTLYLLITDF